MMKPGLILHASLPSKCEKVHGANNCDGSDLGGSSDAGDNPTRLPLLNKIGHCIYAKGEN